ncbi:MAG: hypothetical protein J07HX5_01385 [halophilic archaeon J07HX5]|nr:MAG: hypothetical protein J07HX5_01385 [halophilic archaeon J07HX5]
MIMSWHLFSRTNKEKQRLYKQLRERVSGRVLLPTGETELRSV